MMKIYSTLLFFVTLFLTSQTGLAQCGTNILNNPSFETPVQPNIGNNLTGLNSYAGGWNMTGGPFNIIKTNGSVYTGGPNNAQQGTQYVDVTSASGTVYQDFNITSANTAVTFGGYFSSRETAGYINWTASIDIVSLPSLTVVASSNSRVFTIADGGVPAQENWYLLSGNTTLPIGNYRYVYNIGNYGNVDNAYVYANCVLPIKLQSFTGALQKNSVALNWKIETASNFSHFEVERSSNGKDFNKIANVPLSSSNLYQYVDGIADGNTHYYRLKMMDNDGNFSYSGILRFKHNNFKGLCITGNLVSTHLNISGTQNGGKINLFDVSGKLVSTLRVVSSSFTLNVAQLPKGMYLLQYINGNKMETKKFLKQ